MAPKISASKFKEQCLSLLDNLDPDGMVVTKHGKAVARVIPADSVARL
jgi:antitoxin (DNA-binding transcriptional repressor) of toxin-antitoxin stability system